MDDKVKAVLESYHARMRDEEKIMRAPPATGDGDWRDKVLLAVGPDTGRLINILARSLEGADDPRARHVLRLFRHLARRSGAGDRRPADHHGTAGLQIQPGARDGKPGRPRDHVDFKVGDAVQMISELPAGIDFVLVDLWKDLYVPCLEAFYPKLNPGAIIVADNMLRPANDEVKQYARAVRALPGITSVLLPVGSGIEISRFAPVQ